MKQDALSSGAFGIFRIFGVPVRFHFTFLLFLIFLVVAGVGARQSAGMTVLYILALFGSVLLHELGHALVAKRWGIRTIEIVMYPIGGVARLERSPQPREELWIALAGPFVNLVISFAIAAWLSTRDGLTPLDHLSIPTDANLAHRIAAGNFFLAAFNMLPAFPMDGGRVLRAVLGLRRPVEEATRIAASAGQFLAIAMGLYGLLSSNFILVFIAMFVYLGAAQEGIIARGRTLAMGYPVSAAMVTDFRTLHHGDTIRDAGQLLLATSQQDFPVVLGDQVVGLLQRSALLRAMLNEGPDGYVAGAMDRNFPRLSPAMDLNDALSAMSGSCALVMDGDRLVGMLTTENLSEFLVLRQLDIAHARAHGG